MENNIVVLDQIEDMKRSHALLSRLYPSNFSMDNYMNLLHKMRSVHYRQVACCDKDKVIAVAGISTGTKLWCGKYMDMDNFIVHPDYRSRGIGDALLNYIYDLSRKENCALLSCDVYNENYKAQKFYMNHGFIPRGSHFITIHDENMDIAPHD